MTTIPFRTTSPNPITLPIPTRTSLSLCQFPRISTQSATWHSVAPLRAVKQQERTRAPPPVKDRRRDKKKSGGRRRFRHVEEDDDEDDDDADVEAAPLPKPPAGFVLDPEGRVLMVSSKRLVSMVDPTNNLPLECVIRRVFKSSQGKDCMLLCPVDMPVVILRSANFSGWRTISDEETEAVLPSAAYALAKIHIHFVNSGFCFTARGGFCYDEDDIIEFKTDGDEGVDGMPTEGVEVTCFNFDGSHYMIYTPCDPLLFVAVKDDNGVLQIADDDLLDDPAVAGVVDEETEFNALVEEEIALQESAMGERE
ncbi:BTB/POZ domain protein TNFAIP protein [Rhynchospora pubera]|uniref:BTB/POZ domain protein TNFAIP protein n=1 Tax=Rhynchospora pubera TaxID=906938 RepID=A0AAV8DX28_9POAL|nr:BTB/POZ domain protein TNFAIP protein [Rhynchospora pubera]KAJ4804742.1 BTB/POZ domain protein TNFAIP protein [Rhynchospora pubera]